MRGAAAIRSSVAAQTFRMRRAWIALASPRDGDEAARFPWMDAVSDRAVEGVDVVQPRSGCPQMRVSMKNSHLCIQYPFWRRNEFRRLDRRLSALCGRLVPERWASCVPLASQPRGGPGPELSVRFRSPDVSKLPEQSADPQATRAVRGDARHTWMTGRRRGLSGNSPSVPRGKKLWTLACRKFQEPRRTRLSERAREPVARRSPQHSHRLSARAGCPGPRGRSLPVRGLP
jgi:hypothetical protein